ncbi:MAG: hypothetical protein ACRAVC_12635 [Trichormus sp.]
MTVIPQLQPIVLVCAADNNYVMPLAVTVRSALANLRSDRQIVLSKKGRGQRAEGRRDLSLR